MVGKEEAKEKIGAVVKLYDSKKEDFDKLSESDIRIKLIDKIFRVLGWDVEGNAFPNEVQREETIKGKESKKKKADYTFRLNNIPKFVVEAKATKVDLNNDEFREQVVGYAYNLACSFAVLTNFVRIIIYFVDRDDDYKFYEIQDLSDLNKFDENFEILWFLSKEGISSELLEKEAYKRGIKPQKAKVDKQLYEDLKGWRGKLAREIRAKYKERYKDYETEEIVQRIIDRLIFIRKIEDMELEERKLDQLTRRFNEGTTYKQLKEIFRYYRKKYNSGLFGQTESAEHECDKIDIDDRAIEDVIKGMYKPSSRKIEYNFAVIDADVLGNIYEQYLAFILKETPKITKLVGGRIHRKEQGIYYTPTYIVDYIVKNTVNEYIKDKNIDEILNVKILDPACGSGSFLIRAFSEVCKVIEEKLKKGDRSKKYLVFANYQNRLNLNQKITILLSCVYGVDLDKKAVEIAQLNLLLKLLEGETSETLSNLKETKKLLPMLIGNIKNGNSLIDDKAVAGDLALDWNDKTRGFGEILSSGGFDIVIGNPPYVDIKQLDQKIVRYFFGKYSTVENRMNLYAVFVERALSLLKDDGYFGFIIPNSILYNESYQKIRVLLFDKVTLRKIIRLPDNVFQNVKVETIILIYQKKKETTKKLNCEVLIYPREAIINAINKEKNVQVINFNQKIWESENNVINISTNALLIKLLNKIEEETKPLIDICDFSLGLTPYDKYKGHTKSQIEERVFHSKTKKNVTFKPLLSGGNIIRYGIFWDGKEYISYGNWLGAPREQRFFTKPRIIVRQIISGKPLRIYAGYTEEEFYNTQIAFNILVKDGIEVYLKYLLAILNSKLMNFYHKEKYLDSSKNLFQKILIANAKKFPIKIIPEPKQQPIIQLVDKMLSLNKRLNEIGDKQTDERRKIEEDIERTDKEMNEEVYNLYGITEQEKRIIEESLK